MMAIAPGRACRYPGCVEITKDPSGYCPAHRQDRRRQYDGNRPPAHLRGYDKRWEKFRNWYVKRNPLCVRCKEQDRLTPAEVVHHIKPVAERPDLRLDPANCMALCHDCHEIIHGRKR